MRGLIIWKALIFQSYCKEIEMVERLRERESEREMSKKHHTTPENTENKVTAEGDDAPK